MTPAPCDGWIAAAFALYLLVAYALIVTTKPDDMPGGGMPALVVRSLLWPLILVLCVVAMTFAVIGLL